MDEHVEGDEVVPSFGDDQVRVALGGLDVQLVHGLDGRQVLPFHGFEGPPALDDVALDPAQDAHVGIGVDEDLDVDQIAGSA